MNWIKSFILGNIIWFLLTFLYGLTVGFLNIETTIFFDDPFLNNFLLYPVGIWLGFKITKTPFLLDKKKIDEENFNEQVDELNKGAEEEISKVKSNKDKNPIGNNLVPEKHLSVLAWTVACWRLTIENKTNKMMPEKNVAKFCRLFLSQEKKRKKIKDFNRADVRILKMLSLTCPISEVDKLIAKHGWNLEVSHEFEKEIGYK